MSQARTYHHDTQAPSEYPADLYKPDGLAPVLSGPAAFDDQAVAFFKEQGYVAVANVFTPGEVEDAKAALSDLVLGKNEKFNEVQIEGGQTAESIKDPAALEAVVRKLMSFCKYDTRLAAMANQSTLMNIVRKLAGEDVEIFQEMALLKPPRGREKPWHQDHAYFNIELDKHIVGVWIALDRATIDNGCMHLIPRKHREPVIHFKRRDWQICDTTTLQMKDQCLAVPLEPGGVLFFDSLLPHGTTTNHSTLRRRALQFHYKPLSATPMATDARLAIFGSEGKDVTC